MPRRRLARLCLAAAAVAWGCGGPAAGPYPKASLVLISIDTLRADRLGAYGYASGQTPRIDGLAWQGILFEDAYSQCPLTLPAHASMLTGLLPPHHGVRDNMGFTLQETHRTLATRLGAAGFRTGGAVSAYVLRAQTGIAQGFESYDDGIQLQGDSENLGQAQRDGAIAVDALLRWADGQGGARLFAFLHLYEPHTPYAPPERYRHVANPYDGDVAYADELVGRFLDGLRTRGILERSVVALAADHGEGLGDHREAEHGIFLYREAVHVPLVLRLPRGERGGARIAGTVALVDVAPTLLDLLGVPADAMDGQSLRPAVLAGKAVPRPVYSETLFPRYHFGWSDLYAATEDRYRYVMAPTAELFDIGRDPGEKENLAASRAQTVSAMDGWLSRQKGAISSPEEVPAEAREKLAALGYVGVSGAVSAEGTLSDPKDKIGSYEELKTALGLRKQGRDAEAVALFRKVLADNPRMLDAWESLGHTLVRMGKTQEGIAALVKALEIDPLRPDTHLVLARVYAVTGRWDMARQHAELASRKNPGRGFEALAELMLGRGELDKAAELARRSVAADGSRAMSHFVLGVVAQRAGRCEEAVAAFRLSVTANARMTGSLIRTLHSSLGDCLARLGREAEAEAEFLEEIRIIKHSREGRVGLAMLYRSQGKDEQARTVLAGLLAAERAPSAEAYWTVVRTLTILGDLEAAQRFAAEARGRFPQDARFRPGPK